MVSWLQVSFMSIPPDQGAFDDLAELGPSRFRLCLWPENQGPRRQKIKKPTQKNQPSEILLFALLQGLRLLGKHIPKIRESWNGLG